MIDLSSLGLPSSEYEEFKELCNEIYRFVANEEYANLFRMMQEFPSDMYPRFETALNILLSNSCIVNGSKGFRIGNPPEFEEPGDFETDSDSSSPEDSKYLERMEYIKEVDSRSYRLLSDESFYSPLNVVEKTIDAMNKGTPKTILDSFFIKETDFEVLRRTYKSDAERVISKFSQQFDMDPIDVDLFGRYDLSTNVFIYLFNRSPAYFRLFSVNFDPGYGDISDRLFPTIEENALYIHRTPNSVEEVNICARTIDYLHHYLESFGNTPKMFISAVLGLLNNTSIRKSRLKDIYRQFSEVHPSDYPTENEWIFIFDDYIEADGCVKHLSYDNIQAVRSIIAGINELNYGISVEKLYKSYMDDFGAYYIVSAQELQDFILKYTTYKIYKGRILVRGTLKEALQNFVADAEVYDQNRLIKMYTRRCGGPAKLIEPLLQTIDINLFVNENPLTEEEENTLSARLSEFEWISKDNAKSIFADLHNLEDKFTEMNMHKLGFTSLQDVYYRCKYPSFAECLLQNEFVGEEKYVDDRKFRLKMECRAFSMEVEFLERYLHWIPVSKYKYLNLDSPRYSAFAAILVSYRDKITELCKHQFVTSFSLKNINIGIPEIDEDDFDLEFYEAMLIASKANHQTLARHRFYFIPTDSTSFGPTAPEFIRYLVYNNNGTASVGELQAILESEYGIRADMSAIRTQIKLSTCIFDTGMDAAYLDDEIYMEAMRNE